MFNAAKSDISFENKLCDLQQMIAAIRLHYICDTTGLDNLKELGTYITFREISVTGDNWR